MAFKKRIRLTAFERQIESEIERGEWVPASPQRVKEIIAMAKRGVALRKRGGARPGAGRKALGHVPTLLNLKKETRAYLIKAAGGRRGMGAVVDRLVAKAFG